MGPQHRLRARRGARGILHAAGRGRISGAARPVSAVGKQRFETIAARYGAWRARCAGVVRNHREPAQVPALRRDHVGVGRLGNRGDRAAMAGEIFHFRRGRAGVGGDRDGTEFDTGEPGQHRLDAIVQMNQDILARLDAAFDQARGQRADPFVEFAVSPIPRRRLERRPDQKRMIFPRLAPHPQQPRHVHPGKRPHHTRCAVCVRHTSSRAALPAALTLLGSMCAIGSRGGQMRGIRAVISGAMPSIEPQTCNCASEVWSFGPSRNDRP